MAVARAGTTTKRAAAAASGTVPYIASNVGDLLLWSMFDQGALLIPTGWNQISAPVGVSGLYLWFLWKISAGETGNLAFSFSGSNNYMAYMSRFTGTWFNEKSFTSYAAATYASVATINAPSQGVIPAGSVGWAGGGGYNGGHGTNTVGATGWSLDSTQNTGSPNEESTLGYATSSNVGCQFRFINTFVGLVAASFIITEAPQSGALQFCEA